jgi:5-methylcytosine-specific restriction endonuclease McrA
VKDYLSEKVLAKEPSPESRASLMLLARKLAKVAKLGGYEKWLNFRWNFLLKKQREEGGVLSCFYCTRSPLFIDANQKDANCATLDHVVARSKGGGEYDENNLVVCCNRCNARKKSMSVEEFKNLVFKENN